MTPPMFPSVGRNKFKTKDGEEILVSTIHFNLDFISTLTYPEDHRYYETMIFGGKHDGYQERHTTEDEALIEHDKALSMVREELNAVR